MGQADARLEQLFDQLARLRDEELMTLVAREERPADERRRAREAARAVLGERARGDLEVAEEMLRAWATSAEAGLPTGIYGTVGNIGQLEARQRALPVVADAVLAILAAERLDPRDREALTDSVLADEVGLR